MFVLAAGVASLVKVDGLDGEHLLVICASGPVALGESALSEQFQYLVLVFLDLILFAEELVNVGRLLERARLGAGLGVSVVGHGVIEVVMIRN